MVSQHADKVKQLSIVKQTVQGNLFGFATNYNQNRWKSVAGRTALTCAVCSLLEYYSMDFSSCFPANNSSFHAASS